jgi:hypothetical protein
MSLHDEIKVLVNQIGYDPAAPKVALAQAPLDARLRAASFRLVSQEGDSLTTGRLRSAGSIAAWGLRYWEADFSAARKPGTYRVYVESGGRTFESAPFLIASRAMAKETLALAASFFFYQRCGCEVPGWHPPCHLDDARTPDGEHRDATGGWHDAGDYNKYCGYTPLSIFALAETAPHPAMPQRRTGGGPTPLEEARWGADWVLKMQDEDTGLLWGDIFSGYNYWGPPEKETDNIAGTADDRPYQGGPSASRDNARACLAMAALASRLPDRRAKPYLKSALRFWETIFSQKDLGSIQDSALMLADLYLWRLTHEKRYLRDMDARAEALLDRQQASGSFGGPLIVDQGWVAACLARAALERRDWKLRPRIRSAARRYLRFSHRIASNPFDITQWDENTFFNSYSEAKPWYGGQNSMYLSQAWALLLISRLLKDPAARRLAVYQIDWVAGRNPFGLCMIEGKGIFNPPRYHHCYDSIPGHPRGAVPGAICNGIVCESPEMDAPRFDFVGNAYESNEPWLPHNAYFLLAVSELRETRTRIPREPRT